MADGYCATARLRVDPGERPVTGRARVSGDQSEPFQRSMTVRNADPDPQGPVHDSSPAQAMPPAAPLTVFRRWSCPRLGLATRRQAEPFQRRISVLQPGVQAAPTAQAFPPGRLLTADRLPPSGMLGLTTLDHREPSERRISGRSWNSIRPTPQPPVHMYPTAKMVPAVVTLTAVSRAGLTVLG
jgi:hypothetical protein